MSMYQEWAAELAQKIKGQGLRVFLAERGTYGFFTNEEGSRVVCFGIDGLRTYFSGNYKTDRPQQAGTGWRITDEDIGDYRTMLNAYPPQWATQDAKWKYTTLEQHLNAYQWSSKYTEVTDNEQ